MGEARFAPVSPTRLELSIAYVHMYTCKHACSHSYIYVHTRTCAHGYLRYAHDLSPVSYVWGGGGREHTLHYTRMYVPAPFTFLFRAEERRA